MVNLESSGGAVVPIGRQVYKEATGKRATAARRAAKTARGAHWRLGPVEKLMLNRMVYAGFAIGNLLTLGYARFVSGLENRCLET